MLVQIRFPVAIGEFGSKFEDPQDVEAMKDLALYLGKQKTFASSCWRSLNDTLTHSRHSAHSPSRSAAYMKVESMPVGVMTGASVPRSSLRTAPSSPLGPHAGPHHLGRGPCPEGVHECAAPPRLLPHNDEPLHIALWLTVSQTRQLKN